MYAKITLAALLGAAFFSFGTVEAQAQAVDVGAACVAQPAQCAAIMSAEIERLKTLGLSGDALDSQISAIVSSVFVAAQTTTSPAVQRAMAGAIRTAASQVSNNQAAAGIRQAAAVVNSGRAAETTPDAFGLAPNSNAGTPGTGGEPASDT